MKKFLAVLAIAGTLVACNNDGESTTTTDSTNISTDVNTTTIDTTGLSTDTTGFGTTDTTGTGSTGTDTSAAQ